MSIYIYIYINNICEYIYIYILYICDIYIYICIYQVYNIYRMDPTSFTKTSFCGHEVDNITKNEDKEYILQLLKIQSNGILYTSRYAKVYNEQYAYITINL